MLYELAQFPLLSVLIALSGLALIFGAILGFAGIKFKVEGDPIVDQIDGILPQTQCGQCSYPGCRPYAEAIANGEVINRCPPGGQTTVNALAELLNVEAVTLDTEVEDEDGVKKIAIIREDECIGCTKCIQACPVDAIVGAAKLMHTVITSDCTGCNLCVEPCPEDCIDMSLLHPGMSEWKWDLPLPSSQLNMSLIATDRLGATI